MFSNLCPARKEVSVKVTASLFCLFLLSFALPTPSNGQCVALMQEPVPCDSCGGEVLYFHQVCQYGQQSGGTSCNNFGQSYPCVEDEDCYGGIFNAQLFGSCGGARPTSYGLSGGHHPVARHLVVFIPSPNGGYQEASLTVPGGPSPKTRFASRPRILFIPNSDGSYQDASFAVPSCPPASTRRQ